MKCYDCQEKECEDHCILEDVVFTQEELDDYNYLINTHVIPVDNEA
jgi:hypothetical protein